MHASKLKRKLDNLGVNLQGNSPRLTENFCLIGTPLPPLDQSKDTGEFVPLWKQEVRDEKGRRRLHGAFTGGFSAGYFNTVGSKEGWMPSTFTSSRSDRAKAKQARPEDFMDEEDLAELRESQKLVDTTEEADILGGTQAELVRKDGMPEKDSIATALEALLPAAKDSIGARILKKMGWRVGQGVGPRITYTQLREQENNPVRPDEIIDDHATKHLYAPRDTKLVVYVRKENAFGLGYSPGQGLQEIVNRQDDARVSGPTISAGFGLGALNDAEEDDIDVYEGRPTLERRHMAFDTSEVEDEGHASRDGKVKPHGHLPSQTSGSSTFRNGRPIVSGFALGEKPLIEDRWFPLPDIPRGWRPDPSQVWAADPLVKEVRPSAPQDHQAWKKGKTAEERGSLLGETSLPQTSRSVFDYLSEKDRERLQNLATRTGGNGAPSKPVAPEEPINMPQLDVQTAKAALKGFQPFVNESEKHLRYTAFLNSQVSSDAPAVQPLKGQTNEHFNKELADFAKAAQIFKPVSGAMAGRFASSSMVEVVGNQHHGLHKPTKEEYARLDEKKGKEVVEQEEDPKAHAVKMNMFGALTRDVKVWQPVRLLCKRFGVKDPYPDGAPMEMDGSPSLAKSDAWQKEVIPDMPVPPTAAAAKETDPSNVTTGESEQTNGRRDLSNIGLGEDEEQGRDTLTYERPSKDIFKAIFASDEEESEDEDEDEEPDEPQSKELPKSLGQTVPDLQPKEPLKPYQPTPSTSSTLERVDLSTFKPTFVPKSEREERGSGKEKNKKNKTKKKNKLVVSFELDQEPMENIKKERPRKRHKQKGAADDDEEMWVEKPPPEIVKDYDMTVVSAPSEAPQETGPRGRKRAVDFI